MVDAVGDQFQKTHPAQIMVLTAPADRAGAAMPAPAGSSECQVTNYAQSIDDES